MWSWPHSQLLFAWHHRCDMYFHCSFRFWPCHYFPLPCSLFCQSRSQAGANVQSQHATLLNPYHPFFFFTAMKIKKKGKSMTIFHQSLFLCRFLFFACVWGSRIISRSLLEVRTSIYESATEWWRWFEEKYRQDWHKCSFWTRKSGFEIPLCWHGALLSYL